MENGDHNVLLTTSTMHHIPLFSVYEHLDILLAPVQSLYEGSYDGYVFCTFCTVNVLDAIKHTYVDKKEYLYIMFVRKLKMKLALMVYIRPTSDENG